MSEEAPVGVAGTVTAWGGAGWAFILQGLPGKGGSVERPFLLPAGGQGAAGGAPVGRVLAADVSQPNAAWNRTPGHGEAPRVTAGSQQQGTEERNKGVRELLMSGSEEAWEESVCIWVSSGVYRGGTWLMEIADGKLRATAAPSKEPKRIKENSAGGKPVEVTSHAPEAGPSGVRNQVFGASLGTKMAGWAA